MFHFNVMKIASVVCFICSIILWRASCFVFPRPAKFYSSLTQNFPTCLTDHDDEATVSIGECFAFGFKMRHNSKEMDKILPTPKTSNRRGNKAQIEVENIIFQKHYPCILWVLGMAFQKFFAHLSAQPDCRFFDMKRLQNKINFYHKGR